MMARGVFVDRAGKRYGRLTALFPNDQRDDYGQVLWRCVCDCGREVWVRGSALGSGNTKSCGCIRKEKAILNIRNGRKREVLPYE